jgi:hypothetical protein
MPRCAVCQNDYDKAFEVISDGISRYFDSLECAAHALAPRCQHCSCLILGHGVEVGGYFFCSAHCARQMGENGFRDRA